MLKATLKSALGEMTRRLPWGAQWAVLNAAADTLGRFEVFTELGSQLRVDSISVRGDNGVFWGALGDLWLLGRYAERGSWATGTVQLFQKLFAARGGTFLDIGANIGLTVVPIAANPAVRCIAFEPAPRNFSFLQSNLEANRTERNVEPKQIALFDRTGTVPFELSLINSGDHRIRVTSENGRFSEASRETISVPARRLDDVVDLAELHLPLGVKIDTQGAEPAIIAGGTRTLAAAELISLEFSPYAMRRMGGDVAAELFFLRNNFRQGSITPGDQDSDPVWRPITDITAILERHWNHPGIGTSYLEVFVRK